MYVIVRFQLHGPSGFRRESRYSSTLTPPGGHDDDDLAITD